MTPSGALATLGHIRADIWHYARSGFSRAIRGNSSLHTPKSVDCRPTLGVPMLVQRNERIPTPTIDSGSRSLSFTGLYGGYAICLHRERRQDSAAGHLQIATPLPLIPSHLSGVRTLAPGPRTSVATDYDNRSQAVVHSARENPLGLSLSDLTHNPQSRLRLETSATDVPKQQLNLVMRVS